MIEKIIKEIIGELKNTAPKLTPEEFARRNRIINSDNPNFVGYGHKISEIEHIIKLTHDKYQCNYEDALKVFKTLVSSNVLEQKFAGVFFLNRFKKDFNQEIIDIFERQIAKYCDTWAFCDSTCIRIIGPFLGKKHNNLLAEKTIETWSNSENLWIRRSSMVILIKIIMINRDFRMNYVSALVEKMLHHQEDYINKGIGWLLKTCSNYKPDVIYEYLMHNKTRFPRLILRYASEKLSKERRKSILEK